MGELSDAPSVGALVRQRVRETPDKDAVVFVADPDRPADTASWSYHALDERARAVAAWLQHRHPPGSRVLLLYPVGPAFAAAFLGCQYAGMVAVPAPLPGRYRHQRRRLRTIATDAGVCATLTDTANLDEVLEWSVAEGVGDVDRVATDGPDLASPDAWTDRSTTRETLALLQYTSGSTGDAKGVMVDNGNLLTNVAAFTRSVGWRRDTRAGGWIPLFHDMGLSGHLLPSLLWGTTCVLLDPMTFVRKPVQWLRAVDRFDVTVSCAPNFGYELCLRKVTDEQAEDLDLSRWEFAANGSEPVQPSVLTAFAKRFARYGFREEALAPCYGLAEATVYVSGRAGRQPVVAGVDAVLLERGEFATGRPGRAVRGVISCGPVTDYDVRVVDPATSRVLPEGRIGEVWLRGPSVARGYWRRDQATRETFGARTADGDGGYLRTGDLGALHAGELYVSGRIKDMLIVHGRNLYPQDIEYELRVQHPELGAAGAVFGVPDHDEDSSGSEQVVVTHEVRARPKDRAGLAGLAARMRHTLAREFGVDAASLILLRPGGVRRTTSGKIQRSAMRALFLAGELAALHVDQHRPPPPPPPR